MIVCPHCHSTGSFRRLWGELWRCLECGRSFERAQNKDPENKETNRG